MSRSGETNSRRVQMVGSEAELNRRGPDDMRQSAFPGGTVQVVGSEAQLSRRTTPIGDFSGEYSKRVRGGRLEMVGSESEMHRGESHRGWESYETPISDNTWPAERAESSYPKRLIG